MRAADGRCRPRDARALLRRLLAGRLRTDTCALCLCGEALRPLTDAVAIRYESSEHRLTLGDLVDLMPSDAMWSDDKATRKICRTCINRLSSFYMFSKKCAKVANALRNVQKIASTQIGALNKIIILPYKNIYKYADSNSMMKTYNSTQESFNCTICRIIFQTFNELLKHFENVHNIMGAVLTDHGIEIMQKVVFECKLCGLTRMSWLEYSEHMGIHKRERLIRNVIKNKPFCICCLGENDLVQVSNELFNARSETPINLDAMLNVILNVSALDLYAPSLICDTCIDRTISSYTFKTMVEQSSAAIKTCIGQLEENIQKVENTPMEQSVNFYFDCGSIDIKTEYNDPNGSPLNLNSNYVDHESNSESDKEIDLPLSKVKRNIKMSRKYECSKCNDDFLTFKECKLHRQVHRDYEKHVCRSCLKTFSSIKRLSSHRKKRHALDPLCPICTIVTEQSKLKTHIQKRHGGHLLTCDYCKKKSYTKSSMKEHILLKHATNVTTDCGQSVGRLLKQESKYRCRECSKYPCIHHKYLVALKNEQTSSPKEQYKCIDCDFMYKFQYQILAHANREHLPHRPHNCNTCEEKFPSKEDLKSHININHRKHFRCPHCDKVFKDQLLSLQHIQACQTVDKPCKCDLCSASFISEEKMNFHRRKHFPKNFECQFCIGKYWTKSELNGHLKRSHIALLGLKKSFKKVYQCTMCPLDFMLKKELSDHVMLHAADSRHTCRMCNVSFRSKVNYYGHLRRHNIKKDNECPVCGKFYTKYNIATHLKSHDEKKKMETKAEKTCSRNTMCDVCGRFLANQTSLIKHREVHKEQEQCPHCLKFVNSTIIERHLRNHENMYGAKYKSNRKNRKMFNCTKCEYSSIFADCLEAHENRFHLHMRPFKCDICNKSFYAKITLKEHIRTHSGTKPEQCEQCGNRFVSKKALRLHVRIHTGERPYPCDLCNEKFLSASRRQAHRIRKHFEPSVQCQICHKMYYTQSAVRIHIRDYHSGEPRQRGKKKRV